MQEKNSTLSSFIDLPFLECQTIEKDSCVSYILSLRFEDYGKFVSDGSGQLRRDFFDARGWDFLSKNEVIEQISRALADPTYLEALSYGVTIIATAATVQGKTIQLCNIQIIDGLQITKIIHHRFQGGSAPSEGGNLFVKIIVTSDAQSRDMLISHTSYKNVPLTNAELQALRNRLKSSHSSLKIPVERGVSQKL